MEKVFRNVPFQPFPQSPEKEIVVEKKKDQKKQGSEKERKELSLDLPQNPVNGPVGIINRHQVEQPPESDHKGPGDILFAQQHPFCFVETNIKL